MTGDVAAILRPWRDIEFESLMLRKAKQKATKCLGAWWLRSHNISFKLPTYEVYVSGVKEKKFLLN